MALTDQQQQNMIILSVVSSAVSFIAAVTVVITVFMGQMGYCRGALKGVKVEKLSFHLIAMVSISDAIRTFGNLFGGPPTDSALCGIQAFLKIFGGVGITQIHIFYNFSVHKTTHTIASFAWTTVIAYVMYKLLIASDRLDKHSVQKYKTIFHAICWSFAFCNALIPVAGSWYSLGSVWCFIDSNVLRLLNYYLWIIIVWCIIVVLYIQIWRFVKSSNVDLSSIPTVSRLLYYPSIFFFCWFWSLLRRAWNAFSADDEAPLFIIGCQVFFGNIYGFANAVMYGWIVRYHLRSASISNADREKVASTSHTNVVSTQKSTNIDENKVEDDMEQSVDDKL